MYSLIELKIKGDKEGKPVAGEAGKRLPFDVKYAYYIGEVAKEEKLAYKNLQQLIICIVGYCDVSLDNGIERKTVHLHSSGKALYLNAPVWQEYKNFSIDCSVMILTGQPCEAAVCIRDYDDFCSYAADSRELYARLSEEAKDMITYAAMLPYMNHEHD